MVSVVHSVYLVLSSVDAVATEAAQYKDHHYQVT